MRAVKQPCLYTNVEKTILKCHGCDIDLPKVKFANGSSTCRNCIKQRPRTYLLSRISDAKKLRKKEIIRGNLMSTLNGLTINTINRTDSAIIAKFL